MFWWKRLKVWQKTGIVVAGIHLAIYTPLLLVALNVPPGESGIGYLLIILELPWMIPLDLIFGDALKILPFSFGKLSLLIYGTLGYGLIGAILGLCFQVIIKVRSKEKDS